MAQALGDNSDSDFSEEELSSLDVSFTKASNHVRSITSKLSNDQLLEFYGLYKQGTEGKCTTPRPSWFDSRGRKKWDAWETLKDMPSDDAKQKYIDLLQQYDPEWNELCEVGAKEAWVAVSSMRHSPEPELKHEELSLIDAARENLGGFVTQILSQHPDLKDQKDGNGLTALHWAADRNATKALEACLNAGCNVNAVDDNEQTPLHYAVSCGHVASAKMLLEAGALFLKDDEDCTPLDLATDDEIKALLQSYQK